MVCRGILIIWTFCFGESIFSCPPILFYWEVQVFLKKKIQKNYVSAKNGNFVGRIDIVFKNRIQFSLNRMVNFKKNYFVPISAIVDIFFTHSFLTFLFICFSFPFLFNLPSLAFILSSFSEIFFSDTLSFLRTQIYFMAAFPFLSWNL